MDARAPVVFQPNPAEAPRTRVGRLMKKVGAADAHALHAWSVADIGRFWDTALADLGLSWYRPYTQVLDRSRGLPWTRWFLGGQTNLVLNCLDRHVVAGPWGHAQHAENLALVAEADDGSVRRLTYAELRTEVNRAAGLLRDLGVQVGDRVGIYMPMVSEVVVAFFACLQVGAVAVPVFSAFGADALAVRMKDAGASVLFTADGGFRRGEAVPILPSAQQAAAQCPSLRHLVVLRRTGASVTLAPGRDLWWHERVTPRAPDPRTEVLDAEARSLLLYTSGTTGRPKGTVHTHAGCLATMVKELGYAFDVHAGDRFFWLTDIGWMMGPWEMVGVLALGATLVLFEGAPNWPRSDRLFDIVAKHRVTHLGVAPTAVRLLRRSGEEPSAGHDLSSLRILGSTGEPWDPDSWAWFFERVGQRRCPLVNISGGTEMVGCLLSPLPITPLKPCTLWGPGLGMDVDVVDDAGRPVRGQVGHLVLRQPAPSLTKGFLGDDARYLATYFERFGEGLWYHGDWALVDDDGFWFLHGRSDDTIKVAGKRTGPAEVEAAVIGHPAASEAAAIGVPDELKGEALVVFVVPKAGVREDEALRAQLAEAIATALGKTLRPKALRFVDALPKTRSGKILRRAIRAVWLGEMPGDLGTLDNPAALEGVARSR
ncbi:MAG: AMP-binding protein [Planctomycetia bacterium]